MSPAVLQSRHARVGDFRRLVDRYDPAGKFRNAFLSRNIYEG
jgi:xylitol oxidase